MSAIYSVAKRNIATTAASTKTLLELAAASTVRARLVQWSVSFDGVSATAEPIDIEIVRKSAGGTGTAETEVKFDPADGGPASSVISANTVEGTVGDILDAYSVHPQAGIVIQYPMGREPVIPVSGVIAIRYITPAGVNPNAVATIIWEE